VAATSGTRVSLRPETIGTFCIAKKNIALRQCDF
jgi:hypothetical protein